MAKNIQVVDFTSCPVVPGQGYQRIPIFNQLNTGCEEISLEYVVLPHGAESVPHAHINTHTVVFTLQGTVVIYYGEQLQYRHVVGPTDCVYIPPDIIHHVVNEADTPMIAVVARTPYFNQTREYPHLLIPS